MSSFESVTGYLTIMGDTVSATVAPMKVGFYITTDDGVVSSTKIVTGCVGTKYDLFDQGNPITYANYLNFEQLNPTLSLFIIFDEQSHNYFTLDLVNMTDPLKTVTYECQNNLNNEESTTLILQPYGKVTFLLSMTITGQRNAGITKTENKSGGLEIIAEYEEQQLVDKIVDQYEMQDFNQFDQYSAFEQNVKDKLGQIIDDADILDEFGNIKKARTLFSKQNAGNQTTFEGLNNYTDSFDGEKEKVAPQNIGKRKHNQTENEEQVASSNKRRKYNDDQDDQEQVDSMKQKRYFGDYEDQFNDTAIDYNNPADMHYAQYAPGLFNYKQMPMNYEDEDSYLEKMIPASIIESTTDKELKDFESTLRTWPEDYSKLDLAFIKQIKGTEKYSNYEIENDPELKQEIGDIMKYYDLKATQPKFFQELFSEPLNKMSPTMIANLVEEYRSTQNQAGYTSENMVSKGYVYDDFTEQGKPIADMYMKLFQRLRAVPQMLEIGLYKPYLRDNIMKYLKKYQFEPEYSSSVDVYKSFLVDRQSVYDQFNQKPIYLEPIKTYLSDQWKENPGNSFNTVVEPRIQELSEYFENRIQSNYDNYVERANSKVRKDLQPASLQEMDQMIRQWKSSPDPQKRKDDKEESDTKDQENINYDTSLVVDDDSWSKTLMRFLYNYGYYIIQGAFMAYNAATVAGLVRNTYQQVQLNGVNALAPAIRALSWQGFKSIAIRGFSRFAAQHIVDAIGDRMSYPIAQVLSSNKIQSIEDSVGYNNQLIKDSATSALTLTTDFLLKTAGLIATETLINSRLGIPPDSLGVLNLWLPYKQYLKLPEIYGTAAMASTYEQAYQQLGAPLESALQRVDQYIMQDPDSQLQIPMHKYTYDWNANAFFDAFKKYAGTSSTTGLYYLVQHGQIPEIAKTILQSYFKAYGDNNHDQQFVYTKALLQDQMRNYFAYGTEYLPLLFRKFVNHNVQGRMIQQIQDQANLAIANNPNRPGFSVLTNILLGAAVAAVYASDAQRYTGQSISDLIYQKKQKIASQAYQLKDQLQQVVQQSLFNPGEILGKSQNLISDTLSNMTKTLFNDEQAQQPPIYAIEQEPTVESTQHDFDKQYNDLFDMITQNDTKRDTQEQIALQDLVQYQIQNDSKPISNQQNNQSELNQTSIFNEPVKMILNQESIKELPNDVVTDVAIEQQRLQQVEDGPIDIDINKQSQPDIPILQQGQQVLTLPMNNQVFYMTTKMLA